jgi:hypothetical protein
MQRSAFSSKAGSKGTGEQPSGNVCNANVASSHCLQCLGHLVMLFMFFVENNNNNNTNLLESA